VKSLLALVALMVGYVGTGLAAQVTEDARQRADPAHMAAVQEAASLLDRWQGDPSFLVAAKSKLDAVLRANPGIAAAHREYARLHIMNGYGGSNGLDPASAGAATRSLNEALRLNPRFAEAYVLAGHLFYMQKLYPQALDALAKAREMGTSDPWLPINTASVLMAQGKLHEAAANYQSVIESKTENRKAMRASYEGLVEYYIAVKQYEKVENTYKALLAYEPESAWAHGNYAGFLLCQKDDAEKAIVKFVDALNRMNYGKARSGLAAALYRKLADDAAVRTKAESDRLIQMAQSLRQGDPLQVITSFCGSGPAVQAVATASRRNLAPLR
jgi:tetratricopeptide (TPR) repeat protein